MINNLKFLHFIMMYFEILLFHRGRIEISIRLKNVSLQLFNKYFFLHINFHMIFFYLYDKCILESSWYVLFDIFYNTCTLIKRIQNISVNKQYLELILVFQS